MIIDAIKKIKQCIYEMCMCIQQLMSFEIIEIKAEKKIVELYMYEHIFTFQVHSED